MPIQFWYHYGQAVLRFQERMIEGDLIDTIYLIILSGFFENDVIKSNRNRRLCVINAQIDELKLT